jgi:hypothetical protein
LGFLTGGTARAGRLLGIPAREGLLFDNCIGRKRDVDGGVLAGISFRGAAYGEEIWAERLGDFPCGFVEAGWDLVRYTIDGHVS